MKIKPRLRTLLCMLLLCSIICTLCACPGGELPPNDDPPLGGPPDDNPPNDDPPEVKDVIYHEPAIPAGVGASLSEGSTALTPRPYDEGAAQDIKAVQFLRSCEQGEGKVYRVTNGDAVSIQKVTKQSYDCEGTVLLAPNGFVISDSSDVILSNLTIIGSLTIQNSSNITLQAVEIVAPGTALSLSEGSAGCTVTGCRLSGETAIALGGNGATVTDSYLAFTKRGIDDSSATGLTVQNCMLTGSGTAISTSASDVYIRKNTLSLGEKDTGISLLSGTQNTLVAQNAIKGAQCALSISGVYNTSVVLNSLISVDARQNKNLYICDNTVSGRLTTADNDYFLADGNQYPDDPYDHTTIQTNNQNHNGDSLMDVDKRAEVGADEALLPHVNKDLFVGMERKATVKDTVLGKELPINLYIPDRAAADDVVIIAPGAYTTDTTMQLNAAHKNTTVYAYGVYFEQTNGTKMLMQCKETDGIHFKGITFGYVRQSCGQVYVLEKLSNNTVRVVTGAGMVNEFGNTNASYFNTTAMGAQRQGTFYAYCDTSFVSLRKDNKTAVPTMLMELTPAVYAMLAEGDILTCRKQTGASESAIVIQKSSDIAFKDVTLYGTVSGMAFHENENTTGVEYYRVTNTTQSGVLIDKATYELYRQLELEYGVSLEVTKDTQGRFRGSPAHIGSVDATHVVACAKGSQATSCVFENMCDDATNQHAHHSRLADVRDMGDGKTMLVYKMNLSKRAVVLNNGSKIPTSGTKPFKTGDRIYVYTHKGQLICDAKVLGNTIDLKESEPLSEVPGKTVALYGVLVPTESVKKEALAGFDLTDDSEADDNKVLVDNMDMCCNYFKFDNCKIQNIRSRGVLIKASGGTIQNCTFRNIGMASVAILYELYYGESGVTENLLVDRNLFDRTGYFKNQDLYATVSITGLGSEVSDDFLLYKDITISNNKMINRATDYAIYVNSAKSIKITGNTFGPFAGNDFTNHPENPEEPNTTKPVIHIYAAKDVEISDNTYPYKDAYKEEYVVAEKNVHVYGKDVSIDGTVNGESLIPDNP